MVLRHNTDFTRVWTSGAGSSLGVMLATLAYPLLALSITKSAALAGALGLVTLGSAILARLPAGMIIDRVPLRPALVLSDLTYAAATLTAGLLLATGRLNFPTLAAVAAIGGICTVVSQTAHSVVLRDIVDPEELPRAFALTDGREHAVSLIGQPIGGYLYGIASSLPLLADAAAHTIAAILSGTITTTIDRPTPTQRRTASAWRRDLLTGVRFIWSDNFLRASLTAAAAIGFLLTGTNFALTATLRNAGATSAELGAMFAIAAAGGILGAILASRIQARLSTHAQIALLGWTLTLALLGSAWIHHPLLAGAILAAVYLTAAPANASLAAAQMHRTPRPMQGRVISAGMLIAGLLAPTAPPIAGLLIDHTSQPVMFGAFAAAAGAVAAGIQASRAIRNENTDGPTPPAQ